MVKPGFVKGAWQWVLPWRAWGGGKDVLPRRMGTNTAFYTGVRSEQLIPSSESRSEVEVPGRCLCVWCGVEGLNSQNIKCND